MVQQDYMLALVPRTPALSRIYYYGDDYGSIWTGSTYVFYRAQGYSAEQAAIKTFEYEQERPATAVEKVNIARGWSGKSAQLPVDVVDQAIEEERAIAPPDPVADPPSPESETPLTEQSWFWPTVIVGGALAAAAVVRPLPARARYL